MFNFSKISIYIKKKHWNIKLIVSRKKECVFYKLNKGYSQTGKYLTYHFVSRYKTKDGQEPAHIGTITH